MSKYCVVPGLDGPEVHEIEVSAIGELQFLREYPIHFDTLDEAKSNAHFHVAEHFARERKRLGDRFESEMSNWAKRKELDAKYPRASHVLNVHPVKASGERPAQALPAGIPAAPAEPTQE